MDSAITAYRGDLNDYYARFPYFNVREKRPEFVYECIFMPIVSYTQFSMAACEGNILNILFFI